MRTPLYEFEYQLAAHFIDEGGWEIPFSFGDPDGEYRAVRTDCGIVDQTHRPKLSVEGPEAREFLHGYVTNDIKGMAEGFGCYAALINLKGKMVADVRVYPLGERLILDLEPGLAPLVLEHLDKYTIGSKVELKDVSEELGTISIHGPQAPAILARFLGEDPGPIAELEVLTCSFDEGPLWAIGTAFTGESGFDLIAPRGVLASLWPALLEAGQGMRPTGNAALEMLRVEAGVPRFGHDMDESTIPLEACLDRAISFTKGCYLGQEVIARVAHQGHVNRKLTGLLLDRGTSPSRGAKLFVSDREAGWITTATHSPSLGRLIALGYVRTEFLEPGTRLALEGAGQATVAALPFYRAASVT